MNKISYLVGALAFSLALAGCGGPETKDEPPEPQSPSSAATTTSDSSAPATPAPAPTSGPQTLRLGKISGVLPADWTSRPPKSQMRIAEYSLPTAAGDTEAPLFIVFDFGPGGGGGVEENLTRWKGMMKQPDGKNADAVAKVNKAERSGLTVTTLELPGTYLDRPFPGSPDATERSGYRLIAAVIEKKSGDEGPYFIRLVGPDKSVTAAKPGWERFVGTLKAE